MEEEAARAHEQVADEGDDEDGVMVLLQAGLDSAASEVDEEEVGERVDDFGGVDAGVVVLGEEGRVLVRWEGRGEKGGGCLLLHTS